MTIAEFLDFIEPVMEPARRLLGIEVFSCFILYFLVLLVNDGVTRAIEAARCRGFHEGNMDGVCRCHGCPYRKQCSFYQPRRSFREWLWWQKYKLGLAKEGKDFVTLGQDQGKKEEP